ncbi:MAG: ATP-binding protein, partial [Janthinobacterium lividum]
NPAFRADMVATLQSSVGKMNDLLARLAQRTSGRAEHGEAVDLALLLAEIVSVKSRQHAALEFTPGKEQMFVTADPVRLEQLFGHLIQNAIEASKPGAAIEVDLRQDAATAVIEIADHGTGMSPAFVRNELFKPFRSTKTGGFGIGAYEAREIVRAAGGRLDVTSREGEGSVFTIRLPLALLIAASQSRTGAQSPMRITA